MQLQDTPAPTRIPVNDQVNSSKYKPQFGQYKPHFHGPTQMIQISPLDIVFGLLATLFLWGILIGIWQGFYIAGSQNMYNFITVCTIVYLGVFIMSMLMILFGGRMKLANEKVTEYFKYSLINEKDSQSHKQNI